MFLNTLSRWKYAPLYACTSWCNISSSVYFTCTDYNQFAQKNLLVFQVKTIFTFNLSNKTKWQKICNLFTQAKSNLMKISLRQNLSVEKSLFSVNTAVNWYQAGYSKSLISSDLNNGLISYSRTRFSSMITVSTNFYHRKKQNIHWAKRFRLGSFIKWLVRRHINYHEYGTRKVFYL